MKNRNTFGLLQLACQVSTQNKVILPSYKPDILIGFEQQTIVMPNDYEGEVVCTLVRKLNKQPTEQAVLYIHGFLDYFFQEEVAEMFTKQGYNFYAIDLRKYGRSILPNQRPCNFRKIDEYFADLDAAIAQIRAESNKKLVILAHSTGGLIASLYLNRCKNVCDSLVLNSPFLEMNKGWRTRKISIPVAAFFARLFPNAAVNSGIVMAIIKPFSHLAVNTQTASFYGDSLHKSAKGEWEYRLEWKSLTAKKITLSWLRGIHQAHKAVKRGLDIQCPILVLSSDKSMRGREWLDAFHQADLVLSIDQIQHYATKLGKNVTRQKIIGGKHDLFLSQKPVRENAYEVMFGWLAKQSI